MIAIVLQLLFGGPIADVATGNLGTSAQGLARNTLDILCIAIVGQLVAALGAAVLATRNEFRYPGLAYVAGGTTAVVLLLGLHGPVGILAAPIGVAAGSTLSAALMLWRLGSRLPARGAPGPSRAGAGCLAPMLLVGSIAPLLGQLNFVISLTFAAHLGPGEVTLYTGARSSPARSSSPSRGAPPASRSPGRSPSRSPATRPRSSRISARSCAPG